MRGLIDERGSRSGIGRLFFRKKRQDACDADRDDNDYRGFIDGRRKISGGNQESRGAHWEWHDYGQEPRAADGGFAARTDRDKAATGTGRGRGGKARRRCEEE